MTTKNEKITDYLSPRDLKELDNILDRAIKNAQIIQEIKERNAIRNSLIDIDEQKIQVEIDYDYKKMNALKQKALSRRRTENALKWRAASADPNAIRTLKERFQSTNN